MVFLPLKKFLDREPWHVYARPGAVICGLDEVGRGPWAGPLVACALILKEKTVLRGLKDSKQLKELEREKFYKTLLKKSFFGVGIVSAPEIDRMGIIAATNRAFLSALKDLQTKEGSPEPDFLVVDGRDKLQLPYPHKTIIKGDEKVKIIACASIIAKVTRDRMMKEYAGKYPRYGFDEHKGYGTPRHQRAIKEYGPCEIHRKSYQPVFQLTHQLEIGLE